MGDIVIRYNKRKMLIHLMLCLMMLVGSIYCLISSLSPNYHDDIGNGKYETLIIGLIGIILYGKMFIYLFIRYFFKNYLLIIGKDGIMMSNRYKFISWREIESFKMEERLCETDSFEGPTIRVKRRYIVINLKNPRFHKNSIFINFRLSVISMEKAYKLLNAQLKKYNKLEREAKNS